MKKFDLTWGESVAVRHAFLEQTRGRSVQFTQQDLREMDYTPFNGDARLIEQTNSVIYRQVGANYKHIFLTNGASGACTLALRAYQHKGCSVMGTNPPPFFPLYPAMARAAGIYDITHDGAHTSCLKRVFLLDSPSNPSGQATDSPAWALGDPVIWDAVYHNAVYCSVLGPSPAHTVHIGSYSKLTGINGLRLGWLATNDDLLAAKIAELIAPEYCGLSKPSKIILQRLLDEVPPLSNDWFAFERAARYRLDFNRTEWSKLEKYFQGQPVPVNGMFYYAEMDNACKRLMEKAGVLWQVGSKCGTSDDFGRFNIGQDPKVISAAVKSVLKADKI